MMTRQHRQEALSRAYVQAIAALAGTSITWRTTDYGIDCSLHDIEASRRHRYESGCTIDVQVRSTTLATIEPDSIKYDLDVRTYDHLRNPKAGMARILVLLIMPAAEAQWLEQSENELIVRHCAYWISLRGWPAVTNLKQTRITIPRANMFSVASLRDMMKRLLQGAPLC